MGDLLGGIFDFLGNAAVSALESFVVWLFQLIVLVFQVLYQVIEAVASFFVTVAKAVAGFFDKLWNGFFKGIFSKVWNALKAAQSWLEAKLGPLVRFLQRLRKLLEIYYRTYIRPILLLIQHVRQYLQILTALHIGFAQKLDAWLAQVQNKINQSFATIIGTINLLTDVVNALIDPTYLLRKPALLLSIRRKIPALIRVLTGKPAWYFFPSPTAGRSGPYGVPNGPFNFADTTQNPLTSTLLETDDGIEHIGAPDAFLQFAPGNTDQADVLDYFDDDLYPESLCPNGATNCLAKAWGLING